GSVAQRYYICVNKIIHLKNKAHFSYSKMNPFSRQMNPFCHFPGGFRSAYFQKRVQKTAKRVHHGFRIFCCKQ
ncbi:hypothetical protein, partial [Cronobacter dublinensis]|uniref:hypothetical protein n=1 Tax=Cronobacter dublinensis TaxID=413497 RepID=UPI001F1880DB